jgi:uncharacterized phage protein (TIGR01671 family)
MREYKFRGIDVEDNKWIYGNLITPDNLIGLIHKKDNPVIYSKTIYYLVKPETVGQYTGLKDKHQKEIYDGDIITFNSPTWEDIALVVYYDNEAGFRWMASEKDKDNVIKTYPLSDFLYREYDDVEIIGNLHQNPELLAKGESE